MDTPLDIWEIQKLMGLKKHAHPKIIKYTGVFGTGGFESLGDYDAGLLRVNISVAPKSKELFQPYISISTIDDGGWHGSTVNTMTLEEANSLAEKVALNFPWETKLRTEKELNDYLMEFEMWGEYTG